ncbi:hypothetical protein HDU93_000845 [Gonapodya sp. JEL0774]|nr:hypothetical protein HDU93_000845 [Gonapodya sp. JEL0774]
MLFRTRGASELDLWQSSSKNTAPFKLEDLTPIARIPRRRLAPLDDERKHKSPPSSSFPARPAKPPSNPSSRTHATLTTKYKFDALLSAPILQPLLVIMLLAFHWLFGVWVCARWCASVVYRAISWSLAVPERGHKDKDDDGEQLVSLPRGLIKYPRHFSAVLRPQDGTNSTLADSFTLLLRCALECRSTDLSIYVRDNVWHGSILETLVLRMYDVISENESLFTDSLGYTWIELFVGLGGLTVATAGTSRRPGLSHHPKVLRVHLMSYETDSKPFIARTVAEIRVSPIVTTVRDKEPAKTPAVSERRDTATSARPPALFTPELLARYFNSRSIPDPCVVLVFPSHTADVTVTSNPYRSAQTTKHPLLNPVIDLLRPPTSLPSSAVILDGFPPHLLRTTQLYSIPLSSEIASRIVRFVASPPQAAMSTPRKRIAWMWSTTVTLEGVSARAVGEVMEKFAGSEQRYGK